MYTILQNILLEFNTPEEINIFSDEQLTNIEDAIVESFESALDLDIGVQLSNVELKRGFFSKDYDNLIEIQCTVLTTAFNECYKDEYMRTERKYSTNDEAQYLLGLIHETNINKKKLVQETARKCEYAKQLELKNIYYQSVIEADIIRAEEEYYMKEREKASEERY